VAFIGLLYVFGSSAVMLILSQSSHSSEHFFSLLATDILFVTTDTIIFTLIIYAIISIVIIFILPKLTGIKREIIFFWLFAITVTLSVKVAGVLVVFVILIAPALISMLQNKINKIAFSTIFGSIMINLSLIISYYYDLPTGYAIVFFISLTLVALRDTKIESIKRYFIYIFIYLVHLIFYILYIHSYFHHHKIYQVTL